MKIQSLRQLKRVIALCRAEGITEIEVDGIKLKVGDKPPKQAPVQADKPVKQYTDEDMLYWSSQDITSPLGPNAESI